MCHNWMPIALAGILAGTLDIVYAISIWQLNGLPAMTVLQTIASGILGNVAFAGGALTAGLGLALHFVMTLLMALFYHILAPAKWRQKPVLLGCLYGACIWAAMNLVVVPLSAAPVGMPPLPIAVADIVAHMLLVGVPIAFFARPGAVRER